MRKQTGIAGVVTGASLIAWNILGAIGNLQTAKQLLDNRGVILQTAGAVVSSWWFGPLLTLAGVAMLLRHHRRVASVQGPEPERQREPQQPSLQPVGMFSQPERSNRPNAYVLGARSLTLPASVCHLQWYPSSQGLDVLVFNDSPDAIRDLRLFVTDIRWYSSAHRRFVEIERIHGRGPFGQVELTSDSDQIFSERPVLFTFLLTKERNLCLEPILQPSYEWKTLDRSGIWRVDFRLEALSGMLRHTSLYFQWEPGATPQPCDDPRVKMLADGPPLPPELQPLDTEPPRTS